MALAAGKVGAGQAASLPAVWTTRAGCAPGRGVKCPSRVSPPSGRQRPYLPVAIP